MTTTNDQTKDDSDRSSPRGDDDGDRAKKKGDERDRQDEDAPRSAAEWVSLGVSLLLLAGLVAAIVGLWATSSEEPARFAIRAGRARQAGERYYLPVTLTNEGDETASQVTLEGEVTPPDGGEPETASTTFDFVPGRSTAEAELLFSSDPSGAEIRVTSFQRPLP